MNLINIKKIPKSLLAISLFFSISMFNFIPILFFNIDTNNITINDKILITLLNDIILMTILIFLYRKELIIDFKKLKENFNEIFDTSFKYWFLGLILMMISNIVIKVFFPVAVSGNENTVQSLIKANPLALLITAGFIGPIIEELVFRTSIRDIFKNKWLFVFISALIFGFLHVIFAFENIIDLIYMFPYFFLGLFLAYMVEKTDNNFSSIMMHIFHNTFLVLLSIF